jgi:hypothetical protein
LEWVGTGAWGVISGVSARNKIGALRLHAAHKKPAAHGCGRVLGVTIKSDKNTMFHWTSQSVLPLVNNLWKTFMGGLVRAAGGIRFVATAPEKKCVNH